MQGCDYFRADIYSSFDLDCVSLLALVVQHMVLSAIEVPDNCCVLFSCIMLSFPNINEDLMVISMLGQMDLANPNN